MSPGRIRLRYIAARAHFLSIMKRRGEVDEAVLARAITAVRDARRAWEAVRAAAG